MQHTHTQPSKARKILQTWGWKPKFEIDSAEKRWQTDCEPVIIAEKGKWKTHNFNFDNTESWIAFVFLVGYHPVHCCSRVIIRVRRWEGSRASSSHDSSSNSGSFQRGSHFLFRSTRHSTLTMVLSSETWVNPSYPLKPSISFSHQIYLPGFLAGMFLAGMKAERLHATPSSDCVVAFQLMLN